MLAANDPRDGFEIAESHPFLEWFGRLHQWGIEVKNRGDVDGVDLFASTMIGGRFGIGFDEDGEVILGVLVEDLEKIASVPWATGALVRNVQGADWVGLSGDMEGPDGDSLKIRLFLPMATAIADGIVGSDATRLKVRAMKAVKGVAKVAMNDAFELPLTLRGFDARAAA